MSFWSIFRPQPTPPPTLLSAEEFLIAAGTGDIDAVKKGLKTLDPTIQLYITDVFNKLFDGDQFKPNDINAIEIACLKGQNDVIDILLADDRVKESLNDRDSRGVTVLHLLAIKIGTAPIIQKLLNAGAITKTVNSEGDTPLTNAVLGNNVDVVKLFLDHEESHLKGVHATLDPLLLKDLSILSLEYDSSPIANLSGNPDGFTPLYYAISKATKPKDLEKTKRIIRLLLDHGASPLQRIFGGQINLIDFARRNEVSPDIIKMLQEKAEQIEKREKKKADGS